MQLHLVGISVAHFGDFLATLYNHLGIDWENTTINDLTGRPTRIVDGGAPITELFS